MIGAVLRRDTAILMTYRSYLFGQLGVVASFLVSTWFLAETFADTRNPDIESVGGYFGFLLFGTIFADLSYMLMTGPSSRVREAQLDGTLECLMVGRVRGIEFLTLENASRGAGSLLRGVTYVALAALAFDFRLTVADPIAAALVFGVSVAALAPIGVLAGAVTLLVKRADPVGRLLHGGSMLVSGVVYPLSVMPGWLQTLAEGLPLTHVLRGARAVFLSGAQLGEVTGTIGVLGGFAVGLWGLAWWAARAADRWARRLGTLSHY